MLELGEQDAGVTRVARVGDQVVVQLAENRTTGYRWEIATSGDDVLALDADDFTPGGRRPGAGGVRSLRLRATAPGAARLRLTRRRPWEPDAAGDALELTVEVHS